MPDVSRPRKRTQRRRGTFGGFDPRRRRAVAAFEDAILRDHRRRVFPRRRRRHHLLHLSAIFQFVLEAAGFAADRSRHQRDSTDRQV